MLALGLVVPTCTDNTEPERTPTGASARAAGASPPAIFVGAGDIATSSNTGDSQTAALINALPTAQVFALGDNVYPSGSAGGGHVPGVEHAGLEPELPLGNVGHRVIG
ncbi:MAG: hypothetical protein ABIY46_14110 [Gemmatimonadales bacterium]